MTSLHSSKPEWWDKYRDPIIRDRWFQEGLAHPARSPFMRLHEKHVRHVLDELTEFDAARNSESLSQAGLCDSYCAEPSQGT